LSFIEQLRQDEKKQKIVIDNVKNQLEEKRKELLEAVKKRKVMEKLKEKHRAEYEEESLALEQKNSDEISVLKYGRREK
ncbi:MAG TPA: flagellar export protein FliJ, partial [Smithellaceae bacterium]|nr:flagellar export protein FliJ [Smithellaceae bacterium]